MQKERMMGERWVKLYAKIGDWEWADDPITFAVFVHLLHSAEPEAKRWRGIDVQPGEIVTSLPVFSGQYGITVKQLRTALGHLLSTGEITLETVRGKGGFTKIKIANWTKYQGGENDGRAVYDSPENHDSEPVLECDKSDSGSLRAVQGQFTGSLNDCGRAVLENGANLDFKPVCDTLQIEGGQFMGSLRAVYGQFNGCLKDSDGYKIEQRAVYGPIANPDSERVCGTLQNQEGPIKGQLSEKKEKEEEKKKEEEREKERSKERDKEEEIKKEEEKENPSHPPKNPQTKKPEKKIPELIAEYSAGDEKLQAALKAYVEMRQKMRKPMTAYAFRLMVKKLDGLSDTVAGRIAILDQSTEKSWLGVFPLKDDARKGGNGYGCNNAGTDEYTI